MTLRDIASAAGVVKSNAYRYFESREAILLELLLEEEEAWIAEVERQLAPMAERGDVAAVAGVMTRSALSQPLLCLLTSALSGVMERNVSVEAITAFKLDSAALSVRLGNALKVALPALPHDRIHMLIRLLHAAVAGLWPIAHPAPAVVEALEAPELAPFRSDLERELGTMVEGIVRQLLR